MSVLLWNIRGAGSEASLLYLQEMIRLHKPDLIGILEPKQNSSKIEDFSRKIGYEGWFHGDPCNTHIWIFWKNHLQVQDFTGTG